MRYRNTRNHEDQETQELGNYKPNIFLRFNDFTHVEYGGMKWGMFFVAEYVNVVLISALIVTLFFGGWLAPFNLDIPFLPAAFWFIIKTAFFVMMFVLARGSLMRPRYDQVMNFGWKICLPLALVNLLVTGAVILMNQA